LKQRVATASADPIAFDPDVVRDASLARDHIGDRVRHFARLRAAHRALMPSSADPLREVDPALIDATRECLRELKEQVERPDVEVAVPRSQLQRLDETLDAYQKGLTGWVARLPLAQLRASLSSDTHAQRVEASALLHTCLESEAVPKRLLHVVDYLITLLCAGRRDGSWVMDLDPADLGDVIRARCASGHIETSAESRITRRFQQAAEQLASSDDAAALVREISAYKAGVAGFYFVPSVLRCIIGYNIAARNHFESRVHRGRELDAKIDGDLGLLAALHQDDPRAARKANPVGMAAHEAPGVVAVQEAIRRRLIDDVIVEGPAQRLAAALDLGLLEESDRHAFLDPEREGTARVIRMTVVLGHLVTIHSEHESDLAALSLDAAQLDAWICEVADEVQREVDTLIRGNRFDGAVRLGEVKSRFLSAVRVVARRRLGRAASGATEPELAHEATNILRDLLDQERQRFRAPVFSHLFGGGWRRTAALAGVGVLIAFLGLRELLPSRDPRRIDELDARHARDISPLLASGYRDHATSESMFIATLAKSWKELDPAQRRAHAELIRDRARERGAAEVMLYDGDHVLQAHWAGGHWRIPAAWAHG
jgi:hypothetical protein